MMASPVFPVWIADLVLVLHWLFVLFVVGGEALILLAWWRGWQWARNLWFRVLHLLAIGFVVVGSWIGAVCPLTTLEDRLRRPHASESGYDMSFIGYWLQRWLYYSAPEWVFVAVYTAFALLVVVSYLGYPPRRRIP
jgi:polyferredoxin